MVVEILRIANMNVAVCAMSGHIRLDIKLVAELSIHIISVVLALWITLAEYLICEPDIPF